MARHEPDIRAAARRELGKGELFLLLPEAGDASDRDRQEAITCCLSGGEGWRRAAQRLGGAFAATATKLRGRKAD